jgi:hypothetical protein
VVGLESRLESLPHPTEELLQTRRVVLAVEEGTFNARNPNLGSDGLQVLAVGAETDGDVLVLLAVAGDELWTAEGCQLRCGNSGRV